MDLRDSEDISTSKITYQLELNSVLVYADISTAEYCSYKKTNKSINIANNSTMMRSCRWSAGRKPTAVRVNLKMKLSKISLLLNLNQSKKREDTVLLIKLPSEMSITSFKIIWLSIRTKIFNPKLIISLNATLRRRKKWKLIRKSTWGSGNPLLPPRSTFRKWLCRTIFSPACPPSTVWPLTNSSLRKTTPHRCSNKIQWL